MAPSMQYNDDYREQIKLLSGAQIRLRLIRPEDKQHMVKAFEQLSSSSRHKRFFGAKKALSEGELRYFTEIDQYNHFALCALELDHCDKEIGLGVARFIRLPDDPECAEVGITVIDSAQGKGIGRHLLERLFTAAIERGIKRLRFECLSENQYMHQLVKKLNEHVTFTREHGLLIAEIVIPNTNTDTNQYPMDVIEDLSALIREFSSKTLILYTDFGIVMFKRALDAASEYTMKYDDRTTLENLKK